MDSTNTPYTAMKIQENLTWNGEYYFVEYGTGNVSPVSDPRWILMVSTSSSVTDYSYSTVINGRDIPCDAYPVDSNFQETVNSSYECQAFGFYVLNYLYGSFNNTVLETVNASMTKDQLVNNYPLGTFIRARTSGGGEHTMIYIGSDSTGIIVYHANWDNGPDRNIVKISHIDTNSNGTFSDFPTIVYLRYHTHSYGSWTNYTSSQHKRTCSCGNSLYGSHSYGAWVNYSSVKHKRSCVCGAAQYGNHKFQNGSCTICFTPSTIGRSIKKVQELS